MCCLLTITGTKNKGGLLLLFVPERSTNGTHVISKIVCP